MKLRAWICLVGVVVVGCKSKEPAAPPPGASSGSPSAHASPDRTLPAATLDAPPVAAAATDERWAASVVLPAMIRDFLIIFTRKGDAWTAASDFGGPVVDVSAVTLTADKIGFTLLGREVYTLARTGDAARGTGKIGDAEIPIRMVKLASGAPLRSAFARPQTPKPPFAYASRDLVIDAPDGGKLAATMTVPAGTGPFPAVLLISGSGQQDRDETLFGHKPYLILSDKLTRAGFVTVRYDDRGTGKTVGAPGTLDTEIADDAACIEVMKKQKEIDPKRIGIVGHSTGGMIAPHIAVKTKGVAFIVSLAGVAITGRELVPLQLAIDARSRGTPEEEIAKIVAIQTKLGDAVAKDPATARTVMAELAKPQLAAAIGRAPTDKEVDDAIAPQLAQATAPWTVSYFRTDPRVAWRQLSIPVLLVVGDKDTQVPADVTIKALEDALSPAARPLAKTVKVPGLNHLFQHATTGAPAEYVEIEETFDDATANLVTTWLVEQAKAVK